MPIPVEVYDFGEDMALVYEWCANRVLLNIARRFPYIADKDAKGVFEWQAKKLVEFGQCNQENMRIIRDSLKDVPEELARTLEEQIVKSVEKVEPELTGAAKAGLLPAGATVQPMSDSVKRSFQVYYEQAANKMNLVNTVMLDSTQQAYTGVVTDVVTKITNSQRYLNDAAGSVITGVESVNSAMRQAVNRMVENGLTGFVDHAGRRWRPEAYVQMDVRTTVANAARQAAFDRCDEFGSDIIQIDAHAGARPLCYPWQGKLISRADNARDVTDLYGTVVHVFALSETSYGQAAGLFGVNCRHFGTPFIPGFSGLMNKDLIQPKEENDKRYELTQQQRAMERDIRDARLKQSVAKARGDEEEAQKAKQKVAELSDRIQEFCESNGLPRRRDREYTPVNATWPLKTGPLPYNVQPYKGNAASGIVRGGSVAQTLTTGPKRTAFSPAKTIQEAEEHARQFLSYGGSASYKGIALEYANACNRVIADVQATFGPEKLGSIQPMNMRSKLFKNSTSEAAYRWGGVGGDLFINPNYYKSSSALKKHLDEIEGLMKTVMSGGQALLAKSTGAKRDYIEALLTTGRQCVSQSYDFVEGTFVHECGHMLDDHMIGKLIRQASGASGVKYSEWLSKSRATYGGRISGYAIASNQEYIAESFTAWWFGEGDKIDPVIRSVFEGAVTNGN